MRSLALRRRRTLLVAAAVLLIAVAYALWSFLTVRADLIAAERHAKDVQAAISQGDVPAARRALSRFVSETSAASSRTDALPWKVASHLPFLGDDVRAVRTVADSGYAIGRVAQAQAFPAGKTDLISALAPNRGRVDLKAVQDARAAVLRLDEAFRSASAPVRAVDTSGLTGLVRPSFEQFSHKLDQAHGAISGAATAVQVLPQMLGSDGDQRYLLRFENNAEIRASGGMPGAWALLTARNGKILLTRQGSTSDLHFDRPVLPMTTAEQKIYDSLPGVFWQDTGYVPDFTRNAELGAAMWRQSFPHQPLDGVLNVDTVAIVRMLRVVGPVRTHDGVEITADNAVTELLSKTYQRYPDPLDQNAFFAEVAKLVFDKVTAFSGSPLKLLSALAGAVDEGRVHVYSLHHDVQQRLSGTTIAGEMDFTARRSPQITIGLNDLTQSKMSYYLSSSVHTEAVDCSSKGSQTLRSVATFSESKAAGDDLPVDVTGDGTRVPKHQQLVVARVYGPPKSTFGDFLVKGKPVWVYINYERGRPVAELAVQLEPGQSKSITWTIRTTRGQTGDTVQLRTPDLTDGPFRTTIPSAC